MLRSYASCPKPVTTLSLLLISCVSFPDLATLKAASEARKYNSIAIKPHWVYWWITLQHIEGFNFWRIFRKAFFFLLVSKALPSYRNLSQIQNWYIVDDIQFGQPGPDKKREKQINFLQSQYSIFSWHDVMKWCMEELVWKNLEVVWRFGVVWGTQQEFVVTTVGHGLGTVAKLNCCHVPKTQNNSKSSRNFQTNSSSHHFITSMPRNKKSSRLYQCFRWLVGLGLTNNNYLQQQACRKVSHSTSNTRHKGQSDSSRKKSENVSKFKKYSRLSFDDFVRLHSFSPIHPP